MLYLLSGALDTTIEKELPDFFSFKLSVYAFLVLPS